LPFDLLTALLAPPWAPIDPAEPAGWPIARIAAAVLSLFVAASAATLRHAMAHAIAERVLAVARTEERRRKLQPLLARLGSLSASAGMFETAGTVLFATLVILSFSGSEPLGWHHTLEALLVTVPVVWIASQALSQTLALRLGPQILAATLPTFRVIQWPLAAFAFGVEALRRGLMRVVGLRADTEATREIVADLREVIADSEISGKLDQTEREIIGNVMEVRETDIAAVMTPRTAIQAVEADQSVREAARVAAESGYSRLPVYEDKLDTIIGTVSARDLMAALARDDHERLTVRRILRPAYFVPETKGVSQLLAEFRREKIKLAIVLDEYGGTAGLVTLGDILEEIVGALNDESDEEAPSPLRRLSDGAVEVEAGLHVSEVNEALALDIPEESDFETLGGFVLAELGHFPQRGESFQRGTAEFTVAEANDRRVLKVRVKKLARERSTEPAR
jgi:CBS domain containing-hemolysin-like protein